MAERHDDYQNLLAQKRFLGEVEQGIRFANREVIHKLIPAVTKDSVLAFAVAVGRVRARYLEAAFNLGISEHGDQPNNTEISELKIHREMYEEVRAAFEALRDAIEKGYLDVQGLEENRRAAGLKETS